MYVTCFCEDGDRLSQWRGYADPGGYAIGFDVAALEECVSEDQSFLGLCPVQYGDLAVQDMVKRVIERFPSDETEHLGRGSTIGIEGWAQANQLVLSELATNKSKAFQEEAEWRIIADAPAPPAAPIFRAGRSP